MRCDQRTTNLDIPGIVLTRPSKSVIPTMLHVVCVSSSLVTVWDSGMTSEQSSSSIGCMAPSPMTKTVFA